MADRVDGIGRFLSGHRLRLGMTQEELAERAGVSVRTIRNLETGSVRRPTRYTLRSVAQVLGLDQPHLGQPGYPPPRSGSAAGGAGPAPVALGGHSVGGASALGAPPAVRGVGGHGVGGHGAGGHGAGGAPREVPAQLPGDVRGFTGRDNELAWLRASMSPRDPADRTAVPMAVISGPAGVGKTAMAVRWAHLARDRFPDGQLYVDLRGSSPDGPAAVVDALTGFLFAYGVSVPAADRVDDLAARFRSVVAGRRVLLVLDDAASVDQVRPLLPGSGSCAVLVTSRHALSGLVALHGAHRAELGPLPEPDAIALLQRLIEGRTFLDYGVAAALARRCGYLPLALRIAAELASSQAPIERNRLAQNG